MSATAPGVPAGPSGAAGTATMASKLGGWSDCDRTALVFEDRSWSWRELVAESILRFHLWRQLADPARAPHIGVLLDNVPDYLFWLGAASLGGMTVVGVNDTYRGSELARLVTHTDCQLVVTGDRHAPLLDGLDLGLGTDRVLNVERPDYPELLGGAEEAPLPAVAPEDLVLLIFTSGSTAAPKAVRCTQGRWARTGEHVARIAALGQDDVVYPPLPLFHSSALFTGWASAVHVGAPTVLRRRFSASGFLPDVRAHGVTFVAYTGRVLQYILATEERPDDADNTMRLAVGNEAAEADIATFARRFDCEVRDSYGSTEGLIIVRRSPDMPAGALGRGDDGVEVLDPETGRRTADAAFGPDGRLANQKEAVGELVQLHPERRFEGYYANPEADTQRLRDGIFWSGDLAYRDAEGWLYFAGRNNDWLRVDGENFAAVAVERILAQFRPARAVAVYAVPDPGVGDRVMAAIALQPGDAFDPVALDDFLDHHPDMGPKWRPRYVRVVAELPLLASYKPDKQRLRAEAWRCDDPVWHRPRPGEPLVPLQP